MARTLDRGNLQVALSGHLSGVVTSVASQPTFGGLPHGELSVRYGITDALELGGRLWTFGAGVDGKYALWREPTLERGTDLSVGLGVGAAPLWWSAGKDVRQMQLTFDVPLMFGLNWKGHQFVVGPHLHDWLTFGSAGSATVLSVGGAIGCAFRLKDEVRVVPGLSLLHPVVALSPGGGGFGSRDLAFQFGLGLYLGGFGPPAASHGVKAPRRTRPRARTGRRSPSGSCRPSGGAPRR